MMTNETLSAALEARMLSGTPFTYSGLMVEFAHDDKDRLIDRTIQKMRRRGLIAFKRERSLTIWRPVASAA